jgi:hypothetical protein
MIEMTSVERRKASRAKYEASNPNKIWAKYARRDAKKRALKKGVPFDLSSAYVLSILTDTCPVFGTEFKWMGNGKIIPESPSLDRIIPSLGYVEGNVVIISTKANNIKSAYGSKELYKVADWLYEIEKEALNGK